MTAPIAHPGCPIAVDVALFTVTDGRLRALLIRRDNPPFRDRWALPGGFVRMDPDHGDPGEDLEGAARRELHEETGLPREAAPLRQLGAWGAPNRDPRGRVVTIAYTALLRPALAEFVEAGSDAREARWFDLDALPDLAFDHAEILAAARQRLVDWLPTSTVAFELVPRTFTVQELRAVHQAVQGVVLDPANFRRRVQRMVDDGWITRAPGQRATRTKPAAVYRFVNSEVPA